MKKQPLHGNFRDLQKIAIYYKSYLDFDTSIQASIEPQTPFEFAKSEFMKFHSKSPEYDTDIKYGFDDKLTTKVMIANFLFELQKWAVDKFEGRKPAIDHFRELGDSVTGRTFNDWKNKKSLKDKKL